MGRVVGSCWSSEGNSVPGLTPSSWYCQPSVVSLTCRCTAQSLCHSQRSVCARANLPLLTGTPVTGLGPILNQSDVLLTIPAKTLFPRLGLGHVFSGHADPQQKGSPGWSVQLRCGGVGISTSARPSSPGHCAQQTGATLVPSQLCG